MLPARRRLRSSPGARDHATRRFPGGKGREGGRRKRGSTRSEATRARPKRVMPGRPSPGSRKPLCAGPGGRAGLAGGRPGRGAAGMAAAPRGPEAKIGQYEAFISDVLHRDLRQVLAQREEVYGQLAAYLQLKNVLERLRESGDGKLLTQVDLGCNFYVNAEVPDSSRIFVALGYGFFLELTLVEALRFIDRKSRLLCSLSDSLTRDSARIKAHIRVVLEGLRELQGFQELPDRPDHLLSC